MKFTYPPGATPLDKNEIIGLIPKHITTQGELNEFELTNIIEARKWVFNHKRKDIFNEVFIKNIHKRMFDLVWKWAGSYRLSDKNFGIHWAQISVEINELCKDVCYWIEHKTYDVDEIAIRFHHKLVSIHPFPNGNGRHARLIADIVSNNYGGSKFTWGKNFMMLDDDECRKTYLTVLREADNNNIEPLIKFAKQ